MTTTGQIVVTGKKLTTTDFSISKLRAAIGAIARPNLWQAELFGNFGEENIPENFRFRCEKAEIPGRTLATIDDTGAGPSLKLPYETTYSDMEITIICSEDMAERIFFEKWMSYIVGTPEESDLSTARPGLVTFHEDYAGGKKLALTQLDEAGNELITYELKQVYPIQISPMNLSWEESNTYQRFSVTLTYRHYNVIT